MRRARRTLVAARHIITWFGVAGLLVLAGTSQTSHEWDIGSVLSVTTVLGGLALLLGGLPWLLGQSKSPRQIVAIAKGVGVICAAENGRVIVKERLASGRVLPVEDFDPDDVEAIIECAHRVRGDHSYRAQRAAEAERLVKLLNRSN